MKLPAHEARAVFRQSRSAALATLSARHESAPFLSHVLQVLDARACPVMLLSDLAEHTRNLAADPRVSLMAHAPHADPQQAPRVTLMGRIEALGRDDALAARMLRYLPAAAVQMSLGDFRFYRLVPEQVRLVGGFARAGWIDASAWSIDDFGEAGREAVEAALGVPVAGFDPDGVDLVLEGGVLRQGFATPQPALEAAIDAARQNWAAHAGRS